MPEALSYKTHRAYDPLYHFFVLPVLGLNVLLTAYILFRRPVLLNVWALIFAIALVALTWRVRYFPLRIQDRLIRLEETLRLQRVLPEELRIKIDELSTRELVDLDPKLLGENTLQAQRLLEPNQSVLDAERKVANAPRERHERDREDQRPDVEQHRTAEQDVSGQQHVEAEDREDEEVVQRVVRAVGLVGEGLGHGVASLRYALRVTRYEPSFS